MRRLCMTVLISLVAVGTGCLSSPEDDATDMSTTPDTGPDSGSDSGSDSGGGGGNDVDLTDMNETADVGPDVAIPCAPDGCDDGEVCDPDSNMCVQCVGADDCSGLLCDTQTHRCVECLGPMDCTTGACSDVGACVECVDNSTCTNASASVCDVATNLCIACATGEDVQCEHLTQTPFCRNDACVECDAADDTLCAGNSCDLHTNTCTQTPKASLDLCDMCVTDAECMAGSHCFVMNYEGIQRGDGSSGYCLPEFDAIAGCPARTQRTGIPNPRTSIDGVGSLQPCAVDEALTTCEAVFGTFGDVCSSSAACGVEGAVCGSVLGQMPLTCSYRCNADGDCPALAPCLKDAVAAIGHCGFE